MNSNIPIIDISILKTDAASIAAQISAACRKHGFFYISNHGISIDLQKELKKLSHDFFQLPETEKMKIAMHHAGKAWRGYFPVNGELTSGNPDLKEGIYFGTELHADDEKVKAGIPLHGANLFPVYPPELKSVVLEYMEEVTRVGHLVMKGISLSLGLDENYFYNKYNQDPLILFRIFHYPPQEKSEQQWGVGEHTDYGLLTILKQDEIGGLQVKSGGEWIDAPPIENSFICNIGDMLDRMTGGVYKSTPHRVLNISGKNRYSFPLFFDPGFDTKIERIENITTVNDDKNHRWDNTSVHEFEGTYGDYLLGKIGKVFPELKRDIL